VPLLQVPVAHGALLHLHRRRGVEGSGEQLGKEAAVLDPARRRIVVFDGLSLRVRKSVTRKKSCSFCNHEEMM